MVREMVVYIGRKELWSVYDGRYKKYDEIPGREMKNSPFATCIANESGIAKITDVMISGKDIEAVSGIPVFGERCCFRHGETVFEGTFTDALRYIAERF